MKFLGYATCILIVGLNSISTANAHPDSTASGCPGVVHVHDSILSAHITSYDAVALYVVFASIASVFILALGLRWFFNAANDRLDRPLTLAISRVSSASRHR